MVTYTQAKKYWNDCRFSVSKIPGEYTAPCKKTGLFAILRSKMAFFKCYFCPCVNTPLVCLPYEMAFFKRAPQIIEADRLFFRPQRHATPHFNP